MNRKEQINLYLTLCGKGVSELGSKLYGFAMSFYVLKLTGSAQSFAITLLLTTLPAIVLSPFVGVIVDRFKKKSIVVLADFISGAIMLGLFIGTRTSALTLPMIYFATFSLSVMAVFLGTAFRASYPNIVSKGQLTKLNAYTQGLDSMLSIVAPILGGVIYGLLDAKMFMLINGISFLLSSFSELFINFEMFGKPNSIRMKSQTFMTNMREGLNYVLKKKTFMTIALYALCINFFMSSFSILLPYNLITTHGISPEINGFIQSIFPIGAILMSIYVGRKNTQFSQSLFRNTMLMFGAIMLAFAYPVLPNVALGGFIPIYYALLMGVVGMVVVLVNVPLSVLFQVSLEDEFRGRAMGLFGSLSQGVMPISYLLTGFLLDIVPSYGILIVNAIALILIAISIQKNVQLKAVAVH